MDVHTVISKCEDLSEGFLRKTRKYLPTVARLLLVSTFIEDGLRLVFHTSDHATHYAETWGLNYYFSFWITLSFCYTLLIAPVLVFFRVKVRELCSMLAFVVFCQVILYRLYTEYALVLRNLSVLSALLLLVAEDMLRKPKKFDQLPRDEKEIELTSVMLCICRMCLNLMLLSMVHYEKNFKQILFSVTSFAMIIPMWCGYKTRMISVMLAAWLFICNFFINPFWSTTSNSNAVQYDFFQMLSVVGGLLLMMHTGPGDLSLDELKKKW